MNTAMKNVIFVFLLGLAGQSQAQIINNATTDPTFGFGGFTWESSFAYLGDTPPGGELAAGEIRTGDDALNGELEITGSDNQLNPPPLNGPFYPSEAAMFTTITENGSASFDWIFETQDSQGAYDFFMTIISFDAAGTQVVQATRMTDVSASVQSGLGTIINLLAGDLFGLSIDTADNFGGSATVDISNFKFTADSARVVPVPAALWLFGSAIAGLGFMRKKKGLKAAI